MSGEEASCILNSSSALAQLKGNKSNVSDHALLNITLDYVAPVDNNEQYHFEVNINET